MFSSLFKLFGSGKPSADLPDLPDEIWTLIFLQLSPTMLLDVMLVCERFKKTARTHDVLIAKLREAYPDVGDLPPGTDYYKALQAKQRFQQARIKSQEGRKLLAYLRDKEWDHIKSLKLSQQTLLEVDKDGVSLIENINNQNSQELRDIIFQNICKNSVKEEVEFRRSFSAGISDGRMEPPSYELYCTAAMLNQTAFLKAHQPVRLTKEQDDLMPLSFCIISGHVESAEILLHQKKWTRKQSISLYPEGLRSLDPLMLCAEFDRTNICIHLIACTELIELDIINALMHAACHGSSNMVRLLAAHIPDIITDRNNHRNEQIRLCAFACDSGNVKTLANLIELMPFFLENEFLANRELSLLRYTAYQNQPKMLEYICQHTPGISQLLSSDFGRRVFETAITRGHTDVVRILMTAGAIPTVTARQLAVRYNHPAITALLEPPSKTGEVEHRAGTKPK